MHAWQRVHPRSWSLPVHARQELELSTMSYTWCPALATRRVLKNPTLITMLTYSQPRSQLGSAGEGGAGAELCEGC